MTTTIHASIDDDLLDKLNTLKSVTRSKNNTEIVSKLILAGYKAYKETGTL
jgi:hypothetical protein